MKRLALLLSISYCLGTFHSNGQKIVSDGNYVPNQLVIKIRDNKVVSKAKLRQNQTGAGPQLDAFLKKEKVNKVDRVFQEDGFVVANGRKSQSKVRYDNFLVLSFPDNDTAVQQKLQEARALPEVEFAEPNYLFGIDFSFKGEAPGANGEILQVHTEEMPPAYTPNDPLFAQQQNLQLANVPAAWEITRGDSVVVGVLDTGVDWEHPDLQGNIWINWAEWNGKAGVDDDGNGYIDDIRGWDWINNDNNPTDDNSHGTHVAGIIAARGDNGIGIAGVNWYGKVMCLKVMQSTGRGDAVTIAKGVEYAAAMGAKVLNLSLGGYFESLALKTALENAYAKCFIVAAAGNDMRCIGPGGFCGPLFPAAYGFVLGVQDRALYSNYDQDGPFVSKFYNQFNYDVYASGTSVYSTVPKGGYKAYTGTSMSTPAATGIASLYISKFPNYDKEFLFGHMINTADSNAFVNAYKVLNSLGKPNLIVTKYDILDTCTNCDGDGKPDAGETVNLRVWIKNTWGPAKDVSLKLGYEELADTSLVRFVQDTAYIGDLAPNASAFSLTPTMIKISDNVFHGAEYRIVVSIVDQFDATVRKELELTFENAITFGGILTENRTLYANRLYKVTENLVVSGCTLRLMPGTRLEFESGKAVNATNGGRIVAIGKPDSLIIFSSTGHWTGISTTAANISPQVGMDSVIKSINKDSVNSILRYCEFSNLGDPTANGSNEPQIAGGIFLNCIIKGSRLRYPWNFGRGSYFFQCNIISNWFYIRETFSYLGDFNNHVNNEPVYADQGKVFYSVSGYSYDINNALKQEIRNNVFANSLYDYFSQSGNAVLALPSTIYFGTDDSLALSQRILDFFDVSSYNAIIIKNFRTLPHDSCPGVVWRIQVDDKDLASNKARAEDVIDIGVHNIKIFFNRPMDTSFRPSISFGQRAPFNQVPIINPGKWSADSTIYEVDYEFKVSDPKGIVTFRVADARDDMGMVIPEERTRFRVNLQSSASYALDFNAAPLCGKIQLDWENLRSPTSDIIGYNLYRRKKLGTSTWSAFSLLNKELLLENSYVDYRANLDTTYEYVYTAVRGGMNNELDSSYVVAGKPLASMLADTNGDSSINVLDVVGTVNFILEKDPLPFIRKQSDLNNDGAINVLDVTGIIYRILNPTVGDVTAGYDYNSTLAEGEIVLYVSGDTLYARSETAFGGVQLAGIAPEQWLGGLSRWERINTGAGGRDWILYNFGNGTTLRSFTPIAVGVSKLQPEKWLVSSAAGRPLKVVWLGKFDGQKRNVSDIVSLSDWYPNPTKGECSLWLDCLQPVRQLQVAAFDVQGKRVLNRSLGDRPAGVSLEKVDMRQQARGTYLVRMQWLEGNEQKTHTQKVIIR